MFKTVYCLQKFISSMHLYYHSSLKLVKLKNKKHFHLCRRFCGRKWMEQVIEEFKTVKDMPNFGKNKALPEPNRTVLKVYIPTQLMQLYCV